MHMWALGLSCETPAAPPDFMPAFGQFGCFDVLAKFSVVVVVIVFVVVVVVVVVVLLGACWCLLVVLVGCVCGGCVQDFWPLPRTPLRRTALPLDRPKFRSFFSLSRRKFLSFFSPWRSSR